MAKTKTERGRFSSRKKMEVVLRVLRGDDLDLVSRDAGITAAKLSTWWPAKLLPCPMPMRRVTGRVTHSQKTGCNDKEIIACSI